MDSHKNLILKGEECVLQELQDLIDKNLQNYDEKYIHYFSSCPEVIVNGYMVRDGHIHKLRLMELSGVKNLPESLGELSDLEELWLSGNGFQSIPESRGRL